MSQLGFYIPHGHLLFEEEKIGDPMTFQVAMICSDGWILASDTRAYDQFLMPQGNKGIAAPVLSSVSKIFHQSELNLIYACNAGSTLSHRTGSFLVDKLRTGTQERGAALNDAAMQALFEQQEQGRKHYGGGLLVIFYNPNVEIWTIDVGSAAIRRPEFAFGGAGNLAMFLPQRFYKLCPVKRMKLLVAYTILQGHYCHPSIVDGLELWSGENGQVTKSPDEELADLRQRASNIHQLLDDSFFA